MDSRSLSQHPTENRKSTSRIWQKYTTEIELVKSYINISVQNLNFIDIELEISVESSKSSYLVHFGSSLDLVLQPCWIVGARIKSAARGDHGKAIYPRSD